jgi:hypothetical protein
MNIQSLREKLSLEHDLTGGEVHSVDLTDARCDGTQRLVAHYMKLTDTAKFMFRDSWYAGKMKYEPNPEFARYDGDRIFGEFTSGLWIQLAANHAGPDHTVVMVEAYSDEAKCWATKCTYGLYSEHPYTPTQSVVTTLNPQ